MMHHLLFLTTLALAAPAPPSAEATTPSPARVRLAGELLSPPQAAQKVEGVLVGPVAPCARALGAREVSYDADRQALRLVGANDVEVLLAVGSSALVVNGVPDRLPRPCDLVSGHLVAPLRPVLEALGASVVWRPEDQTLEVVPTVEEVIVRGGATGVKVEVKASSPVTFQRAELTDPARVVLDLPEARLRVRRTGMTFVNLAGVASVRWAQFKDDPPIVRVVLDLIAAQPSRLDVAPSRLQAALSVGKLQGGEPIIERPRAQLLAWRGSTDSTGTTRVSFDFSDPVLYDFEIRRDPMRLLLEIPEAEARLPRTTTPLQSPFVERLSAQPDGSNLQIILDLRQLIGFDLHKSDRPSRLALTFRRGRLRDRLVVIDPGHGGQDSGARGAKHWEKDVNLAVARRVCDLLQDEGVCGVLTRDADRSVGLYERPALANRLGAALFVSIHCNSEGEEGSAQGTETWYYTDRSKCLAAVLQVCLASGLGRPDRGVKRARFVVVRETQMPSALVELAFISNQEEEALLADDAFQDRAARSIVTGLRSYVEGTDSVDLSESEMGR